MKTVRRKIVRTKPNQPSSILEPLAAADIVQTAGRESQRWQSALSQSKSQSSNSATARGKYFHCQAFPPGTSMMAACPVKSGSRSHPCGRKTGLNPQDLPVFEGADDEEPARNLPPR